MTTPPKQRRPDGIRPWKGQEKLPDSEVTSWQIDSAGTFDVEGRPLPRRRRLVKGKRDRAIAVRRAWLVELEAELLAEHPPVADAAPPEPRPGARGRPRKHPKPGFAAGCTLAEFIQGPYREWFEGARKVGTAHERMASLERDIIPVLGKLTLEQANTPGAVKKLKEALNKKPIETSTKNQRLLCLSSVLTTAADGNRLPDGKPLLERKVTIALYEENNVKPGAVIYSNSKEDGFVMGHARHKRLLDDVVEKLWYAAEDDFERGLVGLGLFAGCRISEVGARTWEDIDWEKRRLHIWNRFDLLAKQKGIGHPPGIVSLKNKLAGWVPIPPSFLAPLERLRAATKSKYILDPGPCSKLFRGCYRPVHVPPLPGPSISYRYERIAKRAGLQRPGHYHALRHTFCSRLADAGLEVPVIQKLARHALISTTFGYIAPAEEKMQRAEHLLDLKPRKEPEP